MRGKKNHEELALFTRSYLFPCGPPMREVKSTHFLKKANSVLHYGFGARNTHMSKALNSNVKRAGSPAESPAQKHFHIFNRKSLKAAFKTKIFVCNFVFFVEPKMPQQIRGYPN